MFPVKDVLIVGGGPTGLMLAGDLAAAGVSCAVLERRDRESNLTRAFGVHARTLELLGSRGVADDLIRSGCTVPGITMFGLDLSMLPTRYPYVLVTPQYETERVLAERARSLGAEIVPGAEVVGLRQDSGGVDLKVRRPGGEVQTRRARYVVGADGARSTVRRALGLPFPGRAVVRSVMMCDVRLADPPETALTVGARRNAFALIVPFGDGWYRVIAWDRRHQLPDTAPVEAAEIRAAVRQALGRDHGMGDPRWISRFHSDERQVPRYRDGRVFLAGDAAHVHSPAGGMGMNTGLQDAVNLGWKLAAAVHGWAPEGLLDTYHSERHPVGRRVLRISGMLLRGVLTRPHVLRGLVRMRGALMRVAGTGIRPLARRVAGAISGIDIAYPAPPGSHPLTGRRAPDIPLAGEPGTSLHRALGPARFVLVMPPGGPSPAIAEWADRVGVVTAGGPTRKVVLVRPDGYIAWAADDADAAGDALREALGRWCGPAARHVPH